MIKPKKPYESILNQCMKIIIEESHASDAVVLLFDRATGEVKMKPMRGNAEHIYRLLHPVVQGLAQQGKKSSIILPN